MQKNKMMDNITGKFINSFNSPDRKFGEVPFYWWSGDKLDKQRLTKQLEALAENGVAGVQINYAHMNKGGEANEQYGGHGKTFPGSPEQFTDEWWDFFAHAAKECERLGMGIGMGDYTIAWIGNGFFTDMIASRPEMNAKNLKCELKPFTPGDEKNFGNDVLVAVCFPEPECAVPIIVYSRENGPAELLPQCDEVYVVTEHDTPMSIDPLAPGCGQELVELYFKEFERRLPELKPGTLNYFFQDELLFNCDIKTLWREELRDGIKEKYGYDVLGFLPLIFFDLGEITPKIRLDIADVKTELIEQNYFRPIYDYHASRGLIYGCDQSGRGTDPGEFSDYFRTVRWFTAPGNDTPGRAAHLIKVKVNSSIAHLYKRPRVWLEGYHSSGWGTTLESITAPTSDNFMFGANLLNLHGLYYSTYGGFFEWAPPDFHFRMPYWDDEKQWLFKYKRLAALLTDGVHRCDAAIYYPVSSCDYGENSEPCVGVTFAVAEYLFENGTDFDFIDFQSIQNAVCENGTLNVADEQYKLLLFCGVDCIRFSAVQKAKEFLDNGGTVAFFGRTPFASDRAGSNDPILNDTLSEMLSSSNCIFTADADALSDFIESNIRKSFIPERIDKKIYATKRICGNDTLFFVRYAPKHSVCKFDAEETPYLLDTYTGEITLLTGCAHKNGYTEIKMPNLPDEDTVILFTNEDIVFDRELNVAEAADTVPLKTLTTDGEWDITLIPTLDNTYGDYYLPAGGIIGAQARFFDCTPADGDLSVPDSFKYLSMPYCTETAIRKICPDGDIFEFCKALAKNTELTKAEKVTLNGKSYEYELPPLHGRYGFICTQDYDTRLFEQGHHGLKGKVYDDNMYFDKNSVFVTDVIAPEDMTAHIFTCGQKPNILFVNGIQINDSYSTVMLEKGRNSVIAGFIYDPEMCTNYRNRGKIKRAGLYFTKNEDPQEQQIPLAVKAFANDDFLRFAPPNDEAEIFCCKFSTVPGFKGFTASIFGEIIKAENNGKPMEIATSGKGNFGTNKFTVTTDTTSHISECVLFIRPMPGYCYTSALPEPFDIICDAGKIPLGDTSKMGALKCYSGKLVYTKTVMLEKIDTDERFILNIGDAGATVKIEINGQNAAVFTYRPFTADITQFVRHGENELKFTVSNTLCNHYSTVPSFYSNYPNDAKSGLIGPVTIDVVKTK